MAGIDYGVLIKKNKKLIDDAYIRLDNEVEIHFIKYAIIIGKSKIIYNNNWVYDLNSYTAESPYMKYSFKGNIYGVDIKSKRIDDGYRYYTIIKYKDDLYEIIHGYGIDKDYKLIYKKNSKLMNKLNNFMRNSKGC